VTDIATLVLKADTRQLKEAQKDLQGVSKAGGEAAKGADTANAGLSRLAKVGLAAVITATGAAVAGLIKMTRSAINTADEMMKASQAIGIGVDELSRLRYAAELSGVSFDGLRSSLNIMNRNLFDIGGNGNSATKALDQMGIAARGADGQLRSSTDVLKDMADVFQRMPNGAEKSALAMAVLGRSGAELIPLLNGGADAMNRLLNEADEFGIVIDERTGRRAEEFNDNLTRLGKVFEGLALRIASEMLPHLIKLQDWLIRNQDSIVALANAISTGIDRVINMAYGVGVLVDRVSDAWHSFRNWAPWIDTVTDKIGFLYDKVSFLLNPLGTMLNMLERVGVASRGAQEGLRESTIGGGFAALQRVFDEPGARLGAAVSIGGGAGGGGRGGRSGGGGRSSAISAIEKEAERAQSALAKLHSEFRSVRASIDPAFAQYQRIGKSMGVLQDALRKGVASAKEFRELTASLVFGDVMTGAEKTSEALAKEGREMLRNMKPLENDLTRSTEKIGSSFYDMSNRVLGALNQLAMGIKQGGFLGILSGVLNLFLQLGSVGAFGKTLATNLNPAPTNASRGANAIAGKPYMVGERGPEVFVPGASGSIVPNHAMGGQKVHVTVGVDPANGNITAFVNDQIVATAPAIAQAGAGIAQAQMAQSARRRVR
jgi:hypothetical protein